jgi:hypothetical protein
MYTWNKDSVADETIIKNLRELSGGELQLDENVNLHKVEFKPAPAARPQNNNNRGRNNNNGKNRQNNSNNNNKQRNNGKQRY